MARGELIDFQPHNPVAVEAARIIMTTIYEDDGPDADVDAAVADYFREAQQGGYINYGLIDDGNQLAAAAAVVHGLEAGPVLHTEVIYLAVPWDRQDQGYGRALMRYITERAHFNGDTGISLSSFKSSRGFYKKIGFTEDTTRPYKEHAYPMVLGSVGLQHA